MDGIGKDRRRKTQTGGTPNTNNGGENMSKWVCGICGYVYDEEKEGTPFSALPDGWVCPMCGADKSVFSEQKLCS